MAKQKNGREKIREALVEKLQMKQPDVFKGYDRSTLAIGWDCREF